MLELKRDGVAGRFAERAVGERSESAGGRAALDPELVERPLRRRFSAEYKLRVLREAEACTRLGEIGALLRREGLYTSHLSAWRKQRDAGALEALGRRRVASRPTGAISSWPSCVAVSSAARPSWRRRAR